VTCQGTYFTLEMDSTISPWPKEKLEWGMVMFTVLITHVFVSKNLVFIFFDATKNYVVIYAMDLLSASIGRQDTIIPSM
jgi:hypothetical protein